MYGMLEMCKRRVSLPENGTGALSARVWQHAANGKRGAELDTTAALSQRTPGRRSPVAFLCGDERHLGEARSPDTHARDANRASALPEHDGAELGGVRLRAVPGRPLVQQVLEEVDPRVGLHGRQVERLAEDGVCGGRAALGCPLALVVLLRRRSTRGMASVAMEESSKRDGEVLRR